MSGVLWTTAVTLLIGCQTPTAVSIAATDNPVWWQEAVFYELFVRSFQDSDGDGIGDLQGVIDRLDYLNDGDPTTSDDLGVTALWLMPIADAASYHGYDTLDYRRVHPDYGDNETFQELIDEAHKRGIRVIVDLVLNHTSDQHPWFVDSASSPTAEKRDWYVWTNNDPEFFGPWAQVVWHPANGAYYYGLFVPEMPDLNYTNPDVTAEMHDAARFWLTEMGADGFRLDAIPYLVEEGDVLMHSESTHLWLADFNQMVRSASPDALMVGEIWDSTLSIAPYIENDEVDLAFDFNLAEGILVAVQDASPFTLQNRLNTVANHYPPGQWATFLTNHDMDRAATQLADDEGEEAVLRPYAAATLLLTLPGVPFIYYGEEIGMHTVQPGYDLASRTPMQWEPDIYGAFSTEPPWLGVNADVFSVNVALAQVTADSLWRHYQQLIALRQTHTALSRGSLNTLETNCDTVTAYVRQYGDDVVLVVQNLADRAALDCSLVAPISPVDAGSYAVRPLLGEPVTSNNLVVETDGRISITLTRALAPYESSIVQLIP